MNWKSVLPEVSDNDVNGAGLRLTPLEEYCLLLVEGPDCETFLQGQLTCDVSGIFDGQWRMGAHCSPKGRMISSFIAAPFLNNENAIGLRLHKSIADVALAALKKYAVFSNVTLTILEDHAIAVLVGHNITKELKPNTTIQDQNTQYLSHTSSFTELWIAFSDLPSFIEQHEGISIANTDSDWHLEQIRAGIAEVRSELSEEFLPQEMNFQLTDGVSFKKGCYTGQEIVARLHYRGELKKHMYRGSVQINSGSETPNLGDSIYFDDEKEKACGKLLRQAQSGDSEWEFLALADDKSLERDCYFKSGNSKLKIQWLSLPYAIS